MARPLTPHCCWPTSRDDDRTQPERAFHRGTHAAARTITPLVCSGRSLVRVLRQHSRFPVFGLGTRCLPGEPQHFSCGLARVLCRVTPPDTRNQCACIGDHVSRLLSGVAHPHATRFDLLPRARHWNLLAIFRSTPCDADTLVRHPDLATKNSSQPSCVPD